MPDARVLRPLQCRLRPSGPWLCPHRQRCGQASDPCAGDLRRPACGHRSSWLNKVPTGFIPQQDQNYAIVVLQLPEGASLARTDEVTLRASKIMMDTPGVNGAVAFAGLSGENFSSASNSAAIFATFKPFEERLKAG